MGVRKTPIEKAIDGDGETREARHRRRMEERGLKRVAVWVPLDRRDELQAVARKMLADVGVVLND